MSPRALPRLVAFDLDDTLASSKSTMPSAMATALRRLLDVVPVCIASGGQVGQFRGQVLTHLDIDANEFSRLHLIPTYGTRYYIYDPSRVQSNEDAWTLTYVNDLTPEQIRVGFEVVEAQTRCLGLWGEQTWGTIPGDRGSQITSSALGQEALLDAKCVQDPMGEKRAALHDAATPLLPDPEIRSGGSISIDIILKGVDKAYGTKCLAEMTGIALEEMAFVDDRPDPESNDHPVRALDVPCQVVGDWQDTVAYVTSLASLIASDVHGGEDPTVWVSLGARL